MGQAELQPHHYTTADYFALEEGSEVRHEFFEGEVFAMAGGTFLHNDLVLNCALSLRAQLRGKKCKALTENVQLAVDAGRYYNYPDVVVTCNLDDLKDGRTIKSPLLIIEVLSKSTENRDRSWKFDQYKKLPSLRHYLLVSQKTTLVEWYRREANEVWSFTPLTRFTDEIHFPELDVTLRLQELYEDTGLTQMSIQPGPEAESETD